jgi:hypothetical protein
VQPNVIRHFLKALLAVGLGMPFATNAQEVVIVTVRSFGQGMTEASAIKDAVVEAIGRVSGERITSQSVAETKSAESSTGVSEHTASFQQRIDSLIRGVVKSSRTISVGRDPIAGIYKAEVEVGVASFKQSEQLKRIKLALVMGMQPMPRALGADTANFFQALLNGASDKLVTAQKFAVLERQQRDVAQKEFSRITSGGAPVENFVRLQSAAVADFLVVVDISDFVPGKSMLGSDRARASARATVYDYTSGQIRQSVTASSLRVLRDGSTTGLAAQLGAELAEKIIDNVFPARVIAVESGNPIINAGFGQFEIGDSVDVLRQGQALRDPYTKESLGISESPVAQGVILMVMPKSAVVKLAGSEQMPDLKGASFVVRRSNSLATAAAITSDSTTNPSTKGKKNDDW